MMDPSLVLQDKEVKHHHNLWQHHMLDPALVLQDNEVKHHHNLWQLKS
jgi:hypothetical protein